MSNNVIKRDSTGRKTPMKTTEKSGVHVPHINLDEFPLGQIDAFSRLRVSSPGYRFDSQLTYQIDSDLWDTAIQDDGVTGDAADGTISHDPINRLAILTAKAGADGNRLVVLQSTYHAPYTPGRSQVAFITGVLGAVPAAGGEVGMGYYDGSNGIHLSRDSAGAWITLTTTTDADFERIAQENWNIDPLNGAGPSRITLDLTKTAILVIQLQALYVGRVVVGFDIGGEIVPVHAFNHANLVVLPYIAQASLPVRYWARAIDTAADVTMRAICSSVISEGGDDLFSMPGREFATYAENADVDAAAEAVLAIAIKAQLNGIDQNACVIPQSVAITVEGSGCQIEIRRNATITGGTAASVDPSSVVNAITTPIVTADTGTLIDTFHLPASSQIRTAQQAGISGKAVLTYSHLLGTADNLVIMARGGTNTTVRAALKWKEIR